jgi:hypothetical protein
MRYLIFPCGGLAAHLRRERGKVFPATSQIPQKSEHKSTVLDSIPGQSLAGRLRSRLGRRALSRMLAFAQAEETVAGYCPDKLKVFTDL